MRQRRTFLVCSAAATLLASLAGPAGATGASPPPAAPGVSVRSDFSQPAGTIFPSDRWTVPDFTHSTLRRVALPKPDCAVRMSDCQDIDQLNTLDGFSTQPRITIPFTGDIDPASVSSRSIFLVNLGNTLTLAGFGQRVGINQAVWDVASRTLAFTSDELLHEHSRYLLVVTDGVRSASGEPLRPAALGAGTRHPSFEAEALRRQAQQWCPGQPGQLLRAVAAALFTTQSVSTDLRKIGARLRASSPAAADFVIGTNNGAAVRAVFAASTLCTVQFVRQIGTAPAFAAPATLPLNVLGAGVGQLAYGRFVSPDYQSEPAWIPPTGTLTGEPRVQRVNSLVFQLIVPAGTPPAAGWPVALFGHGGGSTFHNGGVWRLAGALAAQGVATIAIHAAAHGGGPLGTVNVTLADGTRIAVPAGGRGIDQNGNGTIDANEGSRAVSPRTLLGNRDSIRQTVVDQMALVRQIQAGIDIDGDGRPDLDANCIYVAGQSFGAGHGTMLLALDGAVHAGALNVPGGSAPEAARLSAAIRPLVGADFAARVPSLINLSGTAFNEAIPLRDQPVLVNTVAGAFALAENLDWQQWAQQSANPVAYAPYIRRHPLHGQAAKAVLFQFATGDQTNPNPTNTAILRAGELADRATFYRHDLVFAANPTIPKDPHNFLTNANAVLAPLGLAAIRQMATFFATHGATTVDPDGAGPIFEVPIPLPLPETLSFIP